jgi:transcription antitermination factor NusG
MPWFVLYTRPRFEKKVAEQLEKSGVTVYCPLVTQIKQWSDRKKTVQTPLLPSYVFVNITESERQKVVQVTGVVRFVFWLGKPAIVRESEITALQEGLKEAVTAVAVTAYKKGDVITVPYGPFKGKEGTVQQRQHNDLRLLLTELGLIITLTKAKLG